MRANCSVSEAAWLTEKEGVENVQFVEGKADKTPLEDKLVDISIAVYLPIFDGGEISGRSTLSQMYCCNVKLFKRKGGLLVLLDL
jgi:hypothetical protein